MLTTKLANLKGELFAVIRFILPALATLIALLLIACSGASMAPGTVTSAPPATPEEEQVLTIRYWQAPTLPFPYLAAGFKDRDAGAITLEPLANYDPDGNLVPRLAVEIPTLENGGVSQDLLTITWKLKAGVRWSDGSAMTADDAVFTWRYCADEATGCTKRDTFAGIVAVEALDEHTVKITFDKPTPYPYTAFVSADTPIISRVQFADCVGAAARTCEAQNAVPLGTGAYRIVSFSPNEGAMYERNPYYHEEPAYFDRVILQGGGDALEAARSVLVTGDVDHAWNMQVEPDVLQEMEANGLGTVTTVFASRIERIVLNQTNPDPALGDDRSEYLDGQNPHPFLTFTPIAQAMSLAIDRILIADQLYGFTATPACNLVVAPANYASTAHEDCPVQDIAGAKKLLDENGVVDNDGDGIREYNGVPLRITYQTTENSIRQSTQALIQEWWREIGIETVLIQHDAGLFFGGDPAVHEEESYLRFFADVQMYTESSGIDPQQYLSRGLCSNVQARDNGWSSGNNARMCNAEYDETHALLAQTPIGPEREALVKQLNDIFIQNYYAIPLVNRGSVSATLHTLRGVRANAWDGETWNIAEWRR